VLGWADPPSPDFSARFSCIARQYKYFIVLEHGGHVGGTDGGARGGSTRGVAPQGHEHALQHWQQAGNAHAGGGSNAQPQHSSSSSSCASLDVGAMRAAAQHLLGEHDFRNFCKADVLQVCARACVCVCARVQVSGMFVLHVVCV
jgi:tRNA pseudouridine38/39 synthase